MVIAGEKGGEGMFWVCHILNIVDVLNLSGRHLLAVPVLFFLPLQKSMEPMSSDHGMATSYYKNNNNSNNNRNNNINNISTNNNSNNNS